MKRAAYWCELNGAPIKAESNTAMPAAFLMQQMEWREALDEADGAAAIEDLLAQTQAFRRDMLDQLGRSIDQQGDAVGAAQQVRALMFVERFADDLHGRLDRL